MMNDNHAERRYCSLEVVETKTPVCSFGSIKRQGRKLDKNSPSCFFVSLFVHHAGDLVVLEPEAQNSIYSYPVLPFRNILNVRTA